MSLAHLVCILTSRLPPHSQVLITEAMLASRLLSSPPCPSFSVPYNPIYTLLSCAPSPGYPFLLPSHPLPGPGPGWGPCLVYYSLDPSSCFCNASSLSNASFSVMSPPQLSCASLIFNAQRLPLEGEDQEHSPRSSVISLLISAVYSLSSSSLTSLAST